MWAIIKHFYETKQLIKKGIVQRTIPLSKILTA
jgi:hypothetical protein